MSSTFRLLQLVFIPVVFIFFNVSFANDIGGSIDESKYKPITYKSEINSHFRKNVKQLHQEMYLKEYFKQQKIETVVTKNLYIPHQYRDFDVDFNTNKGEDVSDVESDIFTAENYFAVGITDSARKHINRAKSLYEKVKTESRFVELINAEMAMEFPVSLGREIGNVYYGVIFDSLMITPTGAIVNAYVYLPIPKSEDALVFYGRVPFSSSGGVNGTVRLSLVSDFGVNLSDYIRLNFKGDRALSYVEFDCNGFLGFGVDGEIEFSRDWLLPESNDGSILPEGRVKATFDGVFESWEDFLVQVSLDPFQIRGINDFGFSVSGAVFDFSDTRNHPSVEFPYDYESSYFLEGNRNLWNGIFIENVSIRLPRQFNKGGSEHTYISGSKLIFDKEGFTGVFEARNILSLGDGNANGWAFSMEYFRIKIYKNQLDNAQFNGEIIVPIDKEAKGIAYSAYISSDNNYHFTLSYNDDIESNLWGSTLTIHNSSVLNMSVSNGSFYPSVVLNGRMTINAAISEGSSQKAELADISFEGLRIQTVAPHIEILGSLTFGSNAVQQRLAGFPLTIDEIGMVRREDGQMGIGFNVKLNFVGDNSGFGAETRLTIFSELEQVGENQRWKYSHVEINEAHLSIESGAFTLNGSVIFFREDPVYGSGFQGQIEASFMPGIGIQAMAIFGKVDDYRYWFADGMVTLPTGIPIFAGLEIFSFGGGAFYHMSQDGYSSTMGNQLGKSLSGIIYRPDKSTRLGIRATIGISTSPKKEAFNGDVTFEITFNSSFGINSISFFGNGYFITPAVDLGEGKLKDMTKGMAETGEPPADESDNGRGQISAKVMISYDFANSTLYANMQASINVANGMITGGGEVVMYFSPGEWYIYVGHPDSRINMNFAGMFSTTAYLVVGTTIPPMPEPPAEIAAFFVGKDLGGLRNMTALSTGGGFGFGASMSFNTGDLRFMMFYARFGLGAGFDVMMRNYGSDAFCEGRDNTLGINGWYATGQVYAYIEGKVGITVNLSFYKGDFDIFNVGLAALLQAALPNPVWMKGMAGGTYNILGGLVKGKCDFEFEIGEKCILPSSSIFEGEAVIAGISPVTGSADVSVFSTPQVAFNLPVETEFEIPEGDTGYLRKYKIKLEKFEIKEGNKTVAGNFEWNENKDVLIFKSHEILPPQKTIDARVELSFMRFRNGQWEQISSNGSRLTEVASASFMTGEAPDVIDPNNILYAYPVKDQYNFYPNEASTGYVQLNMGQAYLFTNDPLWIREMVLESKNEEPVPVSSHQYNASKKRLEFTIPSGQMRNDKIYALKLLKKPAQQNQAIDANVAQVYDARISSELVEMEVRESSISGIREELDIKELLAYHFKTSKYNTFRQKVESISISRSWTYPIITSIHELGVNIDAVELFDLFEGVLSEASLVKIEAVLNSSNTWFFNEVRPLVYSGYASSPVKLTWRNEYPMGVPPKFGVDIRQIKFNKLTDEELITNTVVGTAVKGSIVYNLPYYMHRDYMDLRNQAANLSSGQMNSYLRNLVEKPYPSLKPGNYPITIKYMLPGEEEPSSVVNLTLVN